MANHVICKPISCYVSSLRTPDFLQTSIAADKRTELFLENYAPQGTCSGDAVNNVVAQYFAPDAMRLDIQIIILATNFRKDTLLKANSYIESRKFSYQYARWEVKLEDAGRGCRV